MSDSKKQPHKIIPEWVFVLGLALAVGGVGLVLLTREIRQSVHPVISEIHALNRTGLRDADGDLSDWIEIWNPTEETIELEGYHLSDNFRQLQRWTFPKYSLSPGGFVIVYASGKNRTEEGGELHTSFRLNPEGEYLVLVAPNGRQRVHELLPKYPKQFGDTTFGLKPEFFQETGLRPARTVNDMAFLLEPSPLGANKNEMLGAVAKVTVGQKRGFYFEPITVNLATKTHGATIRYTLDGSRPSDVNGVEYVDPVTIDRTTNLRVIAYRPGFQSSGVVSHTYIYPAQLVDSLAPNVDTEVFEAAIAGFADIPTVSLTVPDTQIWASYDAGQYLLASLEFIDPTDTVTQQVECGVRISSYGTLAFGVQHKNSFRISIDDQFGESAWNYPLFGRVKPRSFNDLILSSGSHTDGLKTLVSDAWMRATASSAGQVAARSRFVHLFLNGAYRGVCNLAEGPVTPFKSAMESGEPEFDVRISGEQVMGDSLAWNAMIATVNSVSAGIRSFDQLSASLDLERFANYAILQKFANTGQMARDGKWMAVRSREDKSAFSFAMTLESDALGRESQPLADASIDSQSPQMIFQKLMATDEFRSQLEARANVMLDQGGVLSSETNLDRLNYLTEQLGNSRITDGLRWGEVPESFESMEVFLQKRPELFGEQIRGE